MYIALKWLTMLALAMWITMCIIDFYLKNNKEICQKGLTKQLLGWYPKNFTAPERQLETRLYEQKYPRLDPIILHYVMFISGAVAVSLFNKKKQIVSYIYQSIVTKGTKVNFSTTIKYFAINLKKTAIIIYVAIIEKSAYFWVILKITLLSFKNINWGNRNNVTEKQKMLNYILLQKLKEISEERKKLGHLLIAAVHENKNMRTQYKLENMAKDRLLRQIDNIQKKIKESRSKYVSIHHMFLVTNQENIFLKARLRKLIAVKENTERDLMKIVNEVNLSKNNILKDFCSRFIVRPKENLLNCNVRAEVQKFLQKTHKEPAARSQILNTNIEKSIDFTNDHKLVPFVPGSPKLKGLPGECIWTIKDKYGMIEKLYEYESESEFDSGETIRRIREYSVYYDKDCLLDFSRTRIPKTASHTPAILCPITENFLTGSEAFQKFLLNNHGIRLLSR